jgi:hypothetical protein
MSDHREMAFRHLGYWYLVESVRLHDDSGSVLHSFLFSHRFEHSSQE